MSGTSTRPPTRSSVIDREPDGLEDLEELGDDAIIAQQTAAHAPQPRANVSEESRSVVITDHPQRRDTEPPRASRPSLPRSSAEPTLVIRDRRALDDLRSDIERRRHQRAKPGLRPIYLWGALGVAAFVLGGIVAFLATDGHSDAQPDASNAPLPGTRIEAQIAVPRAPVPAAPSKPEPAPRAVRLDDLPVEPPRKH